MKIIVGLGNPDKVYENTFHNLGFMSVDKMAEKLNLCFNKNKFKALVCETKIANEKIILAKPQTYMNLSGESVAEILAFYKASPSDLLVIYDDYDLIKGSLRIRENGSAGTHNGMRNIVKMLGCENFNRVRIGFKPKEATKIPLIDYVLSGISEQDKSLFDQMTELASLSALEFAKGVPIQQVMQKYNKTAE
jgi:PTH1 family peptidyl-tRNA hydrolase